MFIQSEICVLSDVHFGVHQNSPLWQQTALDFANWLNIELKARGVRDILIAGDVFHNRNDIAVNTLNTVAEIFTIWADFNIVILVGNHDAFYKDRSDVNSINILNGWKNIKVYTNLTVLEYYNRKLAICPWGTTIDQIPAADIIFGHFEISSFKMNNFKVCEHGFTSDELFEKSNLIITGHFHLREERNYEKGTIIYLGSPYQLDWSDKEVTKGVYLLDLNSKKYSFIENDKSPKHIEIKLTDLIKAKKIDTLKDLVKGNIIRFVVDKEIETDKVDILAKKLSTYQPLAFSIEYFCFTQIEHDINAQQTDFGVDIKQTINEFIKTMDVKNKDKVYDYIIELHSKVTQ